MTENIIERTMDELLFDIKQSIGLPFQIDPMPGSFTIKTPYVYDTCSYHRKIDPTRVIYRLDISRAGISRSQRTFNPAEISSWYVDKEILPDAADGEVGYKSLDDVRQGFVLMEGMVKVTGPREMGGRMGTVEFAAVVNVETAEIVQMRKAVLRVMGRKIED
jgi:hypothetical protein